MAARPDFGADRGRRREAQVQSYIAQNGGIEVELLYEPPFTTIHAESVDGIFPGCIIKGTSPMARALRFHAVVSGKTLPLPDLSAFEGKRVEVIVREEDVKVEPTAKSVPRRFGSMSGQFVVPDDFDAPLPEDVLAAFEGRDEE